ncbi:MAG: nucleoside/nucleotide kinase family protein [Rhizobiaceae bacterium]
MWVLSLCALWRLVIVETDTLAQHIAERSRDLPRFMVAIAGPPGAGKSTLAESLRRALGDIGHTARIVPMDGFHLDNAILRHRGLMNRKGSPPSFDAAGFTHLVKRLADASEDVAIPTFDRQRDIAIAGAEIIGKHESLLIVEGNYLFLNSEPWNKLQGLWDETIFIDPPVKILEARLVERWVRFGLNEPDARERALSNDIPNAHYVIENSTPANILIS